MSQPVRKGQLPTVEEIRAQFPLREDVCYLNHGACGACPRPVMENWQRWQWKMEEEPAEFLFHECLSLLPAARQELAVHLGAQQQDLVFYENVTTALNAVLRSLKLKAGDEILTTDHEYGALRKTLEFLCARTGAKLIQAPVELPLAVPHVVCEQIWSQATANTRLLFLSHISSPTAVRMPVELLVQRAREAGVLSIIDGAHAPGQIELSLDELGADFYGGNCHKWLMAPPGAAFLHARRECQALLDPLVVSWGWGNEEVQETRFLDEQQYRGTKDISHWLAVPAAWRFREDWNWQTVIQERVTWLREYDTELLRLLGTKSMYHERWDPLLQMRIYETPWTIALAQKKERELRERFQITIPISAWRGRTFVRPSLQGYNSRQDLDQLLRVLKQLL